MIELRPCSACHRHVDVRDAVCPFCGAGAPPAQGDATVQYARGRRLGSAALFGFGASVVAAGIAACGAQAEDGERANQDTADEVAGEGTVSNEAAAQQPAAGPPATAAATDPPAPTLQGGEQPAANEPEDLIIEAEDDPSGLDAAAGAPNVDEDITNPMAVYRSPPTDLQPGKG